MVRHMRALDRRDHGSVCVLGTKTGQTEAPLSTLMDPRYATKANAANLQLDRDQQPAKRTVELQAAGEPKRRFFF